MTRVIKDLATNLVVINNNTVIMIDNTNKCMITLHNNFYVPNLVMGKLKSQKILMDIY